MIEGSLRDFGIFGTIISALVAVIIKQYYDGKASDKAHALEVKGLYEKMNLLQESRITDARETRDTLGDQMEVNNGAMKLLIQKIKETKGES